MDYTAVWLRQYGLHCSLAETVWITLQSGQDSMDYSMENITAVWPREYALHCSLAKRVLITLQSGRESLDYTGMAYLAPENAVL